MLLFSSQLATDLDSVTAHVSVATALFALLVAGPLGVVLAVLALTAGAIAERRSNSLALGRGAGVRARLQLKRRDDARGCDHRRAAPRSSGAAAAFRTHRGADDAATVVPPH